MEVSEGVGGLKTGSDTSRSKFFIVTDGQLLSFPITGENRGSGQNCPITPSAVGLEWADTAFLGGSSLLTGQNLGESCGKGEEGLMSSSSGQWLFLSSTV